MFYDEDLVIDLRLNILNKYVNEFIIVESKYTHSGKKRELLFDINKYSNFKNKINYIILENEPDDLEIVKNSDTKDKTNSKYITPKMPHQREPRAVTSKPGIKSLLCIVNSYFHPMVTLCEGIV